MMFDVLKCLTHSDNSWIFIYQYISLNCTWNWVQIMKMRMFKLLISRIFDFIYKISTFFLNSYFQKNFNHFIPELSKVSIIQICIKLLPFDKKKTTTTTEWLKSFGILCISFARLFCEYDHYQKPIKLIK